MSLDQSLPLKDAVDGSADTLKHCLDYLYRVAMSENYLLTAHLIGAAAESLSGHLEAGPSGVGNGRFAGGDHHQSRAK